MDKTRGEAVGTFAALAYEAALRFGRQAKTWAWAGRRFEALVQNSTDVIAVVGADGVIDYVSPSIERITGRRPEERIGRGAFDLIHPEDVERARDDFADLLRRPGGTGTGEFRIRHADGDFRRVEVVAANRLDEPEVGGVVINYRDVTGRQQAEKDRFRLAAIVESSEDAITSGDLEGRITSWNPGAERLYGRPAREALGRPIREMMMPLDPGVIAENIARVRRGETVGPFDAVHRHNSGSALAVSITLSPIRGPGGGVTGVAAVTRDVGKSREAERALRASEERFRTAFEDAPLGVALADLKGRFQRANRVLCEMLGYTEKELLSMTSADITHPKDLHKSALREGKIVDAAAEIQMREKRYVRKDGRTVWTLSSISLVCDAGGDPSHFVALYQDITGRKSAEGRLEEAERRYRLLVEKVPAVVYLDGVDAGNSAIYRSSHVREVLGYDPEEFLRDPGFWRRLLHPDDRERVLAENGRANRTGEPYKAEYRVFHKDGSVVWLRDEAVLIRDADGRPVHWQGVFMDITERRSAEEETKEAKRRLEELAVLKADFTAMVAHELDTPLAVIRGYADMISTGALDAAGRDRALARIQSETDVLNALVDDVRAVARVERQDFVVDLQPVRVDELLGDAAAFAGSLPGDRELVVHDLVAGAVRADRHRIGQVLRNLLSNASKYSPDGAPIKLRAIPGERPGHVRFEVSDRGDGIPPEDAARIFEKFGRGRGVGNRPGLGLGLYLSRRILQAHGKELKLSPTPGGGSVFGFELEGGVSR